MSSARKDVEHRRVCCCEAMKVCDLYGSYGGHGGDVDNGGDDGDGLQAGSGSCVWQQW